ncbi:MAG TPA: TonB-dependent receptor [Hyphomonadaceae bacterium]|nr:TonB-dependent receptor [Hyphomonadaceae bacterium]HPN06695.1 TonB-dependent receptor [Hyphomonadaceae bacterium]
MRLHSKTSWITLAACAAFAPSALAQTDDPDRDIIVVTGSATPVEYEKLGQTLTVITRDLIDDQGYTYVADVLRQVPGVAVSQSGGGGALAQVRTRGSEGNHTLALLDGIDISSPDTGETDFSSLLSGDLERIEVLRGPQSGLYGSNALAGVVNLISRRDIDGGYVGVSAEGGSFGTLQLQGNAGFGNGDDYAAIGFHALNSDGYDISPDTTAQGVPGVGVGGRAGDKEGNSTATVYLRGGKAINDTFRVDGIMRYLKKDAGLDGQAYNDPIPGQTYDDATETHQKQFLAGASATLDLLDGKWLTTASASYLDEERRSAFTNFPFLLPGQAPTADDLDDPASPSGADASRTKFTLESTYEFGAPGFVNYVTGFIASKKETYGDPFTTRDESRELIGIGGQYRGEFAEQFYVFATVRHDDNDAFDDADTYSVAGSWVIPGTGTRPHASYGTGVTNPTFFEQFGFSPATFTGNPDLVPEESKGWDIGVEQTLFNGMAVVDLTYFEAKLEHEIYTTYGPAPDYFATSANRASKSDRSGWEASFNVRPTADIDIVGSYTKLDATQGANTEIRRPEHQGAIDAGWRIGGGPVKLNLGVTYNGEMLDTDFGTFLDTRVDPYTLVRFGAAWQVNDTVELYGRVENLTDEDYQEVIGFKGAPQAFYIGIRFREETNR